VAERSGPGPRLPIEVPTTDDAGRMVSLAAGETLFREGDPADAVFLVMDGEVDVVHQMPGAEPYRMATLTAGAVIGECGVLAAAPRSASVVARSPATLWAVGRESFLTAAELGHPWAVRLLLSAAGELAERLRTVAAELVAVTTGGDADPAAELGQRAELQRLRDRLVEWSF
jgi:SulP family sulfate permease